MLLKAKPGRRSHSSEARDAEEQERYLVCPADEDLEQRLVGQRKSSSRRQAAARPQERFGVAHPRDERLRPVDRLAGGSRLDGASKVLHTHDSQRA
jgi:hypothetical protein